MKIISLQIDQFYQINVHFFLYAIIVENMIKKYMKYDSKNAQNQCKSSFLFTVSINIHQKIVI